jgi:hypothetical protein
MPTVGFEPAIPVSERPQNDALDRAATAIGSEVPTGANTADPLVYTSVALYDVIWQMPIGP